MADHTPASGRPSGSGSARWVRPFQLLCLAAAATAVLQAVWAGIFIREHRDYPHFWIQVHARGAEVDIALAAAAALVGWAKLRARSRLGVGATVLTAALVAEAYIGGLVGAHPALTALHFPLAMVILGLAVWLPVTAGKTSEDARPSLRQPRTRPGARRFTSPGRPGGRSAAAGPG